MTIAEVVEYCQNHYNEPRGSKLHQELVQMLQERIEARDMPLLGTWTEVDLFENPEERSDFSGSTDLVAVVGSALCLFEVRTVKSNYYLRALGNLSHQLDLDYNFFNNVFGVKGNCALFCFVKPDADLEPFLYNPLTKRYRSLILSY